MVEIFFFIISKMDLSVKQLIVLDDIRDRLEMIDSDIKPGSLTHPVEACTQNVAANVYSTDGTNYNGDYVTLPLSPLTGNILNVDKSYIHVAFELNPNITIKNSGDEPIGAANTAGSIVRGVLGERDTASTFSRIDFMIGGTSIFSTTFQQLESAIGLASLPSDVVEHSSMYATLDKVLSNKDTPGKLLELDIANLANGKYKTFNLNLNYDFCIDLNRLAIPLSDIHYISKNMGQLSLRLYFNKCHESFYFTQLPDGFTSAINQGVNGIVQMLPVLWNNKTYKIANAANTAPGEFNTIEISFNTTQKMLKDATGTGIVNASTRDYFFKLKTCEICQECFTIDDESYAKLEEFFIDCSNKVIIPIHVLNTTMFSNGSIDGADNVGYPTTLNAQVSNQNITKLFVSQFLPNNQSAILNPYFQSFTLYYNGMPLNQKPYEKINQRAINDFTQTMLDTDSEEINNDYLASLSFGSSYYAPNAATNTLPNIKFDKGDTEYFYENQIDAFLNWNGKNGYSASTLKLAHLCPLAYNTAVDGSFQTGLCVNSQGAGMGTQQVRLVNTTPYNNSTWNSFMNGALTIPNAAVDSTNIAVSALLDACIVLQFDPIRHYCVSGELSYVKPYNPIDKI